LYHVGAFQLCLRLGRQPVCLGCPAWARGECGMARATVPAGIPLRERRSDRRCPWVPRTRMRSLRIESGALAQPSGPQSRRLAHGPSDPYLAGRADRQPVRASWRAKTRRHASPLQLPRQQYWLSGQAQLASDPCSVTEWGRERWSAGAASAGRDRPKQLSPEPPRPKWQYPMHYPLAPSNSDTVLAHSTSRTGLGSAIEAPALRACSTCWPP